MILAAILMDELLKTKRRCERFRALLLDVRQMVLIADAPQDVIDDWLARINAELFGGSRLVAGGQQVPAPASAHRRGTGGT